VNSSSLSLSTTCTITIVFFGEIRVVRDHELVGDVDRTAERRLGATQLLDAVADRRRGGLFALAPGDERKRQQRWPGRNSWLARRSIIGD
jgi:hypothetical protein